MYRNAKITRNTEKNAKEEHVIISTKKILRMGIRITIYLKFAFVGRTLLLGILIIGFGNDNLKLKL